MGGGIIRQTITDDDLRAIARFMFPGIPWAFFR